eukprot:TRINITY_DN4142_c0_g1_i1.p1 TRINITY_DN4142_c0_g1~~TRINITY_DN4142_c0_g1_i1.p1  ORF type:complete len:397 (-),score=31.91 TRINITY_DN4142_c0_g1_i1:97-1287(-)
MKKEHNIDQLFKKGMEDLEIPFNELDWQKMAQKLAASEARKTTPLWIYAGAGVAAALLLLLFIFLADQNQPTQKRQHTKVKTNPKPGTDAIQPAIEKLAPALEKVAHKPEALAKQEPSLKQPSAAGLDAMSLKVGATPLSAAQPMLLSVKPTLLNTQKHDRKQQIALVLNKPNPTSMRTTPEASTRESQAKSAVLEQAGNRGKLTFTFLAAPDITDSKTSVGTKISSNLGLLLTYPLSKKMSISTGAIYARKLYDYGGNVATVGQANLPWSLNADCYVIDVPVNVNYQILSKKNYSITLNSGVSSYFMLKEKYKFSSTDAAGVTQQSMLELNNQNKHLLGIANISVSIERKVSDKVSVGIQPFIKLPLTGIGYYDYNLRSRGVALSLSIKPFGSKN